MLLLHCLDSILTFLRKWRDLNPRESCDPQAFRELAVQPLRHTSIVRLPGLEPGLAVPQTAVLSLKL